MRLPNKNLLSAAVIILFAFFAMASRVNKIHYGAFNYGNKVEDSAETKNYLVKSDGTRIYGEKISWKSGIAVKDQVKIDEQKFKMSDVIGYRQGGTYYGKAGNEFIERIVHGKLNVYVAFSQVTSTTTNRIGATHTSSYTRTDQYVQRGETGPMIALAGQKQIKELVSDCPAAFALADLSDKQIRKAIKADKNYLNNIFDTYNNDCK